MVLPSYRAMAERHYGDAIVDSEVFGSSGVSATVAEFPSGDFVDLGPTQDHLLTLVTRGSRIRWRFDRGTWTEAPTRAGQLLLWPAGLIEDFWMQRRYGVVNVAFPDKMVRDVAAAAGLDSTDWERIALRHFEDEFIRSACQRLTLTLRRPAAVDTLFVDHLSRAVILQLFRRAAGGRAVSPSARRLGYREMRELRAFVAGAGGSSLGLRQLAGVIGMSAFHFARSFKLTTGESPHQWVLRLRLDRAVEILRADPRLSSEAAARACGFADKSHLGKAMRRVLGISPRDVRR